MKTKPRPKKSNRKYYTLEEANATLPLLRAILRDITSLARELRDRYEQVTRLQKTDGLDQAHADEVQHLLHEYEQGQEKMHEYEAELKKLSVELKDYYSGLVDFRHLKDGREVYLCWRFDEPEVAHWHELNAGFAGRKEIVTEVLNG